MRDIKRIDRILKKLGILWKKSPDWRFGQLLINFRIVPFDNKIWNRGDDGFEEYLEQLTMLRSNAEMIETDENEAKK